MSRVHTLRLYGALLLVLTAVNVVILLANPSGHLVAHLFGFALMIITTGLGARCLREANALQRAAR